MSTPDKEAAKAAAAGDSTAISVMTDALRERLKSPFFSALLIAWVVINWRAILFVAFDSSSILARILFVDAYYLTVWKSAALPFIAAFAYVTASPWSSDLIAWWRGKAEHRINCRKLEDLDALAKKQRDIDDPGGLKREMKQLNEDITRAKEFLAQAQTLEAETKDRTATLERDSIEKNKLLESEKQRHAAVRSQIEKDIQGLSKTKERFISEIASSKDERDRIRDTLKAHTSNYIDVERAKKIIPLFRRYNIPISELRNALSATGLSLEFVNQVTSSIVAPPRATGTNAPPPPAP